MGAYQRKLKSTVKWRYQGYYKGTRYTGPAIYDSRQDAIEAERVYLASLKGDSLQSLMSAYLNHLRINTTNHGYHKHSERVIQKFIDFLGQPEFPVKAVSRRQVEEFKQAQALERQEAGQSPHSVNYGLRILKAFFYYAIRVKEIDMRNPAVYVKHQALNDDSKYIPTDDDLTTLRETLDREEALLVDFCTETGCRINEALRLTSKDIGPETVTLWTRKSKNSNLTSRIIPRPHCLKDEHIPPEGERVFKRWTAQPRFLEKKVKALMEEKEPFTGKPLLSHYFNWHNLRHKAASEWHHNGMVLVEIMARLGHSNIETTQKYLQSLGFTTIKYTEGDRPVYQSKPTKADIEEGEKASAEEDEKVFEWLREKVGTHLAGTVVFGIPDEKTELALQKFGITSKLVRDYRMAL